ncbi:TonB-dependent receptor [Oceanimonas baumannii]|uniref:Catecholate siderophore receptor n=1 Tax=Oceanimonas baumannii TaxID=129578 RepID=A0A235CLQ3_9GAMM|nr:TonB-dependent siderophore receptor [Oceanimonas baumannii]OYD25482.1 TonB-dependent siderophore receptor [Oceanimonas baumannii]TDW61318.1 catecholate siderophore receptor [Oceanimonas baumannii]
MRTFIRSTSFPPRTMLGSAVGMAVAGMALPAAAQQEVTRFDTVTVKDVREQEYKTDASASAKYVKPLLDTPQTITVVPEKVIKEQQALSLRQVLSNVSGITFAAGEGGGGSGDSINIRGFSANSNMQIDGLRDSSQNNRTDTFNIEQVEVLKGPNSVFGGAGTTGGAINQVSKTPKQRDFAELGASLGTDNYRRLTLDANQSLKGVGVDSAARINLMAHENDVPGRNNIDRQRFGIAPSVTIGLSEQTRATLSYFHQQDDNLPDYGLPARDGKVLAGVDRDNYYGWRNLDEEKIQSDAVTLKLEHKLNDTVRLENQTRYSRIDRDTTISASHVNTTGVPSGNYQPAGPQGYRRDVRTELWVNQASAAFEFDTGRFKHDMLVGGEISRETYDLTSGSYNLRAHYPANGFDLYNPPGTWTGPANYKDSGGSEAELNTRALYVFDTITLHPQWDLSLGLRHDWVSGETSAKGNNKITSTSDQMFSGRAGIVYKPADNGRVYLAYGTSFNPSAEALATSGRLPLRGAPGAESLSPEKNETWELGTKWELMNGRLGLDAALFRVNKNNVNEKDANNVLYNAGEQRVQGAELGLTGKLTEQWKMFANYTLLDSETLSSVTNPDAVGRELQNTPRNSANLWTTYEVLPGVELGYGARYVGSRSVTGTSDTKIDSYWVHNAMASYQVTDAFSLQLNVNNLFDEDYVERVRGRDGSDDRSSAVELGDGRSAVLSASYRF